ncbi:hypothetical protein FO519_005319 [Halicephalobus sp. NKZ332]|nr:hypothetical protein FO519_005319 [Halicephalobus sp. NKZ332]
MLILLLFPQPTLRNHQCQYPDNTVVILFNAQKSISQRRNLLCVSENTTHQLNSTTKAQFAYNPTRECKFGAFIAICSGIADLQRFGLSKTDSDSSSAQVSVRDPYSVRSPVVVCFSPLFYFEKWQLLLTSLEIYKFYGADLQVIYVQSMLLHIYSILEVYAKNGDIAVEPWATHDLSKETIEKIGFNPNLELDWRNQAAAHTDCTIKYREAADFIIIADLDDVLVPKLEKSYIKEFRRLTNSFPNSAAFSYLRFNVVVQEASSSMSFSLSNVFNSSNISMEKENQKYVLNTKRTHTAWIHWPGIVAPGFEMYLVPEENFMLHFRNWTNETTSKQSFDLNPIQVGSFMSPKHQVMMEADFNKRISTTQAFKDLPSEEVYLKFIVSCYDNMFYSRKRQPDTCPGPVRCVFKPQPGVHCMVAKKYLQTTSITPKLRVTSGPSSSAFIMYKNGCSME